jgi:hypothetical protein
MWDSVYALMFGKYGLRGFNFQHTLDNLYTKQHPDGFICREIAEEDGTDRFHRFDPSSTGPNILPWSEWEYFLITGDKERLKQVFPVLLAYHQWLKAYRTWPNGTYWSSGWGAGLDNQPRLREKGSQYQAFYHGHMVWLDICIQAVFSAKTLIRMSEVLGRKDEVKELEDEVVKLASFINDRLWDEDENYYFDLYPDNKLSDIKTISAYWALLADIVSEDRLPAFISHLEDPKAYKRAHRVPSMPADAEGYNPEGDYWRGGVWVFTNYMLLRGLTNTGYDTIAYEIALNHLENVVKVFKETDTIWENYSPEFIAPGNPAKRDFVGAGGVTPITILFEYVFGLRPKADESKIVWDVRRLEAHGVEDYPLGERGILNLKCSERRSHQEEPDISVTTNIPVEIEIRWNHETGYQSKTIKFDGN